MARNSYYTSFSVYWVFQSRLPHSPYVSRVSAWVAGLLRQTGIYICPRNSGAGCAGVLHARMH